MKKFKNADLGSGKQCVWSHTTQMLVGEESPNPSIHKTRFVSCAIFAK